MKRTEYDSWKGRDVARLLSLVESERRYYQNIVSRIPIGLAVLDEDLRLLAVNDAFRSKCPGDRRDLLGRDVEQALPLAGLRTLLADAVRRRLPHVGMNFPSLGVPATPALRVSITPLRKAESGVDGENGEEFLLCVESVAAALESVASETAAEQSIRPAAAAVPPEPAPPAVIGNQQQHMERLIERLAAAAQQLEDLRQAELQRAQDSAASEGIPPVGAPLAQAEAAASEELAAARQEVSRIRAELAAAQLDLERLRQQAEQQERLRPAIEAVEKLRTLEREVEELREAKAKWEASEAELAALRPASKAIEELRAREAEIAQLRSMTRSLESEVEQLRQVRAQWEEAQSELAALRPAWDAVEKLRASEAQVAQLEARAAELTAELETVRAAAQQAVNRYESAEAELEQLRSSRESIERLELNLRSVERLRAAAEANAQRFSSAVEMVDAIVWEADAKTFRTVYVSRRAQAILGFPIEQWMQETGFWINRIHPDDRSRVLAIYQSLSLDSAPQRIEYRAAHADSHYVWLRENVAAVRDPETGAHHLRGVCTDVTAWKKLSEPALQSEKMESLARLAARLSHDFNNYLSTISGYSEFILERMGGYAKFSPFLRDVEEIKKASERAAALTRQLLLFSQKQVLDPHVMSVNQLLLGMENLLRRLMGENVDLELVLSPDAGNICVDPTHFEPAILNLAVNARDAMPQGGKLTIETMPLEVKERNGLGSLPPGGHVVVRVSDTGHGMEEETLRQIFEPFFTTRTSTATVGLGLSTVYGFVRQSGGQILVTSQQNQGTTFELYFPAAAGEAESPEAPAPQSATLFGNETVLLVEHDDSLRSLIRSVLQRKGYALLEASRADEALRIAERREGELDLLIADWMLPDMPGPTLASAVRRFRPRLGVLLLSAYEEGELTRKELPRGAIFLAKPFTLESLLRKLREALHSRPGQMQAGA